MRPPFTADTDSAALGRRGIQARYCNDVPRSTPPPAFHIVVSRPVGGWPLITSDLWTGGPAWN